MGAPHEEARAKRLADGHDFVEVLPRMSLEQVAQVLAGARGVVSVDTGLFHLTAALDKANFTLYGPTDPGLIGGYGKPVCRTSGKRQQYRGYFRRPHRAAAAISGADLMVHCTSKFTATRVRGLFAITKISGRIPKSPVPKAVKSARCSTKVNTFRWSARSALKNSAHGEVLLTATGPSTRRIDFSRLPESVPVMGVNRYRFSDTLRFSFYTIVDMEFYDKQPDIIRSVIGQPDLVLFTTMHGIAKIYDRYPADLRCRLALIEDGCYKIYQPKVASSMMRQTYQHIGAALPP